MSWQISLSVIAGEAFKAEARKHIRHPYMWDSRLGDYAIEASCGSIVSSKLGKGGLRHFAY